jgi:hypothetical protein
VKVIWAVFNGELFDRPHALYRREGDAHHLQGWSEGYESQVCNIAAQLTADGKTLIEDLHAFIELRGREIK